MPFDIEGALRGGIDRTFEDSGLTVAGAFFVLGALSSLAAAGTVGPGPRGPMMPGAMGASDPYGVSLGLPVALAGVVSLVAWVATVVLAVAAIRLFVSNETDRVPQEFFTRNMVWAWINYVIGGIVFGIVVGIGLVFLIVPGVFLLVSLIFWTVFVAVEDENFVESFRRSWRLTKGHRWMVFGLGFAVAVIVILVNAVFGGIGVVIRGFIGLLVAQVGSALTTTFATATLAQAYHQLVELEPGAEEDEEEEEE